MADLLHRRLQTSAGGLGVAIPPAACRGRVTAGLIPDRFTLKLRTAVLDEPMAAWLGAFRGESLRRSSGRWPSFSLQGARWPTHWVQQAGVDINDFRVRADGSGSLGVEGMAAPIALMRTTLRDGMPAIPLTLAQESAVRQAWEAGYYEVPRPLSLATLAKRMGTSPASLSELLRRAERTVIGQHVQDRRRAAARVPPRPTLGRRPGLR